MTRSASVPLATSVLVICTVACGHPATRDDCETIFRRTAELTLREGKMTDKAEIAQRVAAVRTAKGEALLKSCVGKRITDGAMRCVREAPSKSSLEACLR
jgi:hypothetical protein